MSNTEKMFAGLTTPEIITAFSGVINSGTAAEIDMCFTALKYVSAPTHRDVLNGLEDKIISRARHDAALWNDAVSEDEKQASLGTFEHLKPMAQVFVQIVRNKDASAQPWTKTFVKEFSGLFDVEKESVEILADCVADVDNKAGEPQAEQAPQVQTAKDIYNILHGSGGVGGAITTLEMNPERQRLIDDCEKYFLDQLKSDAVLGGDVPSQYLQRILGFGNYIVAAKGAAADPLMKSYLDVASRLPVGDDYYFHQPTLVATAQSHLDAVSMQQKLKQLAARHKVRLIGPSGL
jgi:hypothetical protein